MWPHIGTRSLSRLGFLLLTILLTWSSSSEAHIKLNVPRVRLPYFDTTSVNFTLTVETPGCYQWSVTRPDIISLIPSGTSYYDHDGVECSSEVVISAGPRVSPCCPASAIVYVEDRVTKEVGRCDVIIDKIVGINIQTTTKELHMEEAPSAYYIEAHGSKGDKFSTVDGIPFRWWLEPIGDATVDTQSILRIISFYESTYQAPPGVAALEARRLQGSTILVEGLKTGSAKVSARLMDPSYKNVPAAEVQIVVVANLQVDPHEVYVVPDTQIPLKLRQIRYGKLIDIPLPSKTYSFEVTNTSVVSYDPTTSVVTALNYGFSDIIVKDKNALSDTLDMEYPEGLIAHIYVREPRFLALSVSPHRNWALQIGQEYEIQVDIYDEENQKIYISDNIQVETTFDSQYFRVDTSAANGTHHAGVPIKTGSAPVYAELRHMKKLDGSLIEPSSPIRIKADMEIFQPVVIHPKETILPWDPNLRPKHDIKLTASGGNGNFFWSTTNTSVVTITQAGVARTEGLGFANVTAAMTINTNIKGHGKIYILPPTSMEILEHNVEAEVGIPILVPLAFYTVRPDDPSKAPVPYSNCHEFPFQVTVEDPLFTYDKKTYYPASKPACAYLPIIGSALGSSLVTVTYRIGDQVFSDSVTVSTFKPLKVVEPTSAQVVLAVGSSRQLAFEGGPRPLLEKHGFFRTVDVTNATVARTTELKADTSRDDLYVYRVVCQEVGEANVTLEVGNRPKKTKNARAISRVAQVQVTCGEPAQIYFKVETPLKSGGSKCPSDAQGAQVVRVAVPNYENTRVVVTVKDTVGKKFDNITSLNIKWTAVPTLASVKTENWVETEGIPMVGYETVGDSYQIIVPRGLSGNVELKSEILGYRKDVLAKEGLKDRSLGTLDSEWEDSLVADRVHSMELQLVGDVQVEPAQLGLFNHAASKSTVKILEGSGHFEYELVGDGVVNVNYFESNKTLHITPLTEGNVRIIVRDLCLSPRKQAEIDVQVNGIGSIEIVAVDKVQINHEANVSVILYDKAGKLIPPSMVPLIRLKLSPVDTGIVEITRLEISEEDRRKSRRRFVLRGVGVGQATLAFTADGPGRIVRSPSKRVSVFPPLTLRPKNVTLLVGSVYQIQAIGGPQPDTNIVYRVKDREQQEIATVTPTGVIQGRKIGDTSVIVESVDRAESTVYSEDSVLVKVVNLRGVRIHAPLTRIQSQKEMPLYIMGIGEGLLEPTVLVGDRKSLLSAEWSYNNHEIADLIHPFQENGYIPEIGDQMSIRFKAKQAGRVTVKVFVVYNREQHMDEIEIEILNSIEAYAVLNQGPGSNVYDELKLVKVPCGCQNLLMTPFSELNLRTNRDPSAKITYSVQPTKQGSCIEGIDCQKITEKPVVTVDSNGIVRSNDLTGQAVITVFVLEDFGMSLSLSVTIDVKPVSYLMITPKLPVALSGHDAPSIPRGISFPFTVTYHDNIGRAFDATQATPRLRASRLDLVQLSTTVENNTFLAQASHEGRVCIKVYDKANPQISDFLVLSIGEAIEPKLPMGIVTVGDVICFSCVIKSKSFRNGYWAVEPTGPLEIDASTGMVQAVSPGLVRVEYTIPSVGAVTSVELNVVGIDQIKWESTGVPSALTNGDYAYAYDIFVNFGDKRSNLVGSNCSQEFTSRILPPFSCSLRFENRDIGASRAFTVIPVFVFAKRQYACRITVVENVSEDINLNLINSDLLLSAHVNPAAVHTISGTFGREVRTEDLRFAFHPALTLHTHELTVWSNDLYVGAELKVTGLPSLLDKIQIVASDAASLRVEGLLSRGRFLPYLPEIGSGSKGVKSDATKPETRTYVVYVQSDFWSKAEFDDRLKLSVTVFSPATHQQFTIPVKIKFRPPFADAPHNLHTWTGMVMYFGSQANTWLFTPVFYTVVMLIAAQLLYRSFVTVRSKTQKDSEPSVSVFKSRSESDQSYGSKSQVFRDLTSRSSSASPGVSPFMSYAGGGAGDTTQSPVTSSASSPVRSRLFSAPEDEYFGSPYRRSSPR